MATMWLWIVACSAQHPLNPSFPLTRHDAAAAIGAMRDDPKPLVRPLIILSGLYDPGWACDDLVDEFQQVIGPREWIVSVHFVGSHTFAECAARVIDAVDSQFRTNDTAQTVEVDVVACSMGGLVGRYSASLHFAQATGGKRLRVARMFTISTPHRGARSAFKSPIDRRIADMMPDSSFVTALEQENHGYEIIPYVCLNDGVVGEENAAPAGQQAWWVDARPLTSAHMAANDDCRILADIARRLRGETPFTREPAAALPPRGLFGREISYYRVPE